VSAAGDLAVWHTGGPDAIPAVGGAMDLTIGARDTFVMMSLLTRGGQSKLVADCNFPLTGVACVSRVYTDLAAFLIDRGGSTGDRAVLVRETHGISFGGLAVLVPVPMRRGVSGR
jgi:3-oxoadipate CoA-transferase, beta subunit